MATAPRAELLAAHKARKNVAKPKVFKRLETSVIEGTTQFISDFFNNNENPFLDQDKMSSLVLELQSKYGLTEIESQNMVSHVKDSYFSMSSDSLDGTSLPAVMNDSQFENIPAPTNLTTRTVSIKNKTYVLGPILGKGGFGVVRLGCQQNDNNRQYALKFISKAHMKNNLNFIKREIKYMRKVNHEHVLKLFRYGDCGYPHEDGSVDPSMLLVTEYCPNGELFDIIFYTKRGLDLKVARTYFQQLIAGVDAIHQQNIFHRDLKPQNILLDQHFQLKICDFGLSNMWKDKSGLLHTKVGTKGFMAPEMILRVQYNEAVDIFSSGVILFNITTGVCPFRNADPNKDAHYYRVATKDEKFWKHHPGLDDSLKDLIENMLAYQPADRWEVTHIMNCEWWNMPIYDNHELRDIMVDLHAEAIAKKHVAPKKDFLDSIMGRAGTDANPDPPLICPMQIRSIVKPFHTYQLQADSHIIARACLTNALQNYEQKGAQVAKNGPNWVYSVEIRHQHVVQDLKTKEKTKSNHPIMLQIRFFRLEEDGVVYFTLFRSDEGFSEVSRKHMEALFGFLLPYVERNYFHTLTEREEAIELADDFESESEIDEEAADAGSEPEEAEEQIATN